MRRKTAKDIRREETRARLLAVAKALFSEHGYDDVSVTEIGREAGVSHSMINVYFGGKPGLLYEIVRESNAPQYDATVRIAEGPGTARERLIALLRAWAEGDGENPRLLAIMHSYSWVWPDETEADNRAVREKFRDVLTDLIAEGQAAGEFRPGIDPAQAASAVWAIYTWGLRPFVFENAAVETCLDDILAKVSIVLHAEP